MSTPERFVVSAFYKFAPVVRLMRKQKDLRKLLPKLSVKGTILISKEGINGTITGTLESVEKALEYLRSWPGFESLEDKKSFSDFMPFEKMKVKLKPEIVVLKEPSLDPRKVTGDLVDSKDWNSLISRKDIVTLDTRNDYEVELGTFKGALDPKTKTFTEFKDFVRKNLNPEKNKEVAMFCTGGIRCEKASAFMLKEGFEKVYQLNGGILKYLEETKEENSSWQGECFVFDDRVALDHNLESSLEKAKKLRKPRGYKK